MATRERRRITVEGIVQGIGFRPFVYGLAQCHNLVGHVLNDSTGVTIEVEGAPSAVDAFVHAVENEPPPLAVIERVAWEPVPLGADTAFVIQPSHGEAEKRTFISPDVCVCDDCLRELFDPGDRRYRYPFINCTNCGPRFTIIRDVPYDRSQTTMARFPMCLDCQREYDDPSDRRFHAQPNACPRCGPQVRLVWTEPGNLREFMGNAAIVHAQQLLSDGAILAIKGLGGYHLACDAMNEEAVARLRARKHREDKPFALMARDLEAVEALCCVSPEERTLLTGRQRPIVLLRQRFPSPVADAVAPSNRYLGCMLPYTPLHYLLLDDDSTAEHPGRRPAVLVMTSGNLSDEPIAYRDDDASRRLAHIADGILTHDRDIHMRCDDSVVRSDSGSTFFIRRSRGYAPQPITLPFQVPRPILAVGAHLKNTFCLAKGRHAFVGHHIGDLENLETLSSFAEGIDHFARLFDIEWDAIAHDLHPDYLATRWAEEQAEKRQRSTDSRIQDGQSQSRLIPVQHHHAHIASVMAEHSLDGQVIGVAFDGTGYGMDGRIWGGEFLIADQAQFTRAAHLAYVPLPGGEAAIRQPWRIAAAWLHQIYGDDLLSLPIAFTERLDHGQWRVLRQMIMRGVNSPLTSSMGRLFDAVAALIGVRQEVNYEGQPAVELELLADEAHGDAYHFDITVGQPHVIDAHPVIRAVVRDLAQGVPPSRVAMRFHNGVARMPVDVCMRLREETGLDRVALSGGVFQNRLVLTRARDGLRDAGFEVHVNTKVPVNDGGISLGQTAVAAAQLATGSRIGG